MKKMIMGLHMGDKIGIYIDTIFKIIRGFLIKPLLRQTRGLLFIGRGSKISHKGKISVGSNVKFERYSEIQGLSRNGLSFEDNVTIGAYTMIRPSSYYGVDLGDGFEIGHDSSIGPFSYIGCAGYIKIGNNVMIGPKVSIFAENHVFSDNNIEIKKQGTVRKGVIIEDNCWIGSNVVILDGVTIGEGSVIGAGAIITKNIPKNSKVIDKRDKMIKARE